jgi:hypothetical protein
MKKLMGVVSLALMLVFAGAHIDSNADANTITELHNIALNGADAVSYTFFSVTTAGTFNISADGQPTFTLADPEIYLFINNNSPSGALTGAFVATNDNSGVGANPLNSLIANISLAPNNYVLAVGAHVLMEPSARSDFNNANSAGTVLVTIASANGVANLQVPEPASFLLVGFGLLAFRFALRRVANN